MTKLLTHEVLAKEVFNKGFSSGVNSLEQWKEELRNREGDQLVTGLVAMVVFGTLGFVVAMELASIMLKP